jgi:hypothetical protein
MRAYVIAILLVVHTTFSFAETKTAIKPSELNSKIVDDIHKNYPGYTIIEAFKINTKGTYTFEAIIHKDNSKITLLYDVNGVFIRKVLPNQNKPLPVQRKVPTKSNSVHSL